MRASLALTAAVLASNAAAAPAPASTSGLVSSILGTITDDLDTLLSSLGVKLRKDSSKHGVALNYQNENPFDFTVAKEKKDKDDKDKKEKKVKHDIKWKKGVNGGEFIDWKTFKANGANLGGWLEKERTHDPIWWESVGGASAADEWSLCALLGDQCGPIFEERYASFLNTSTIDQLASVGVNVLRIPTTYAAWVDVPGSNFYHGKQQDHLKKITKHAIENYGMHIIIGLHSLPGGINNLDIGEGFMRDGWFYNATNLNYSFQAVDGILNFIKASGYINAFTIGNLNEASDNLSGFGSAAGLSDNATDWINTYTDGCLAKIAAVDKRIPLMLQDNFKGAGFWAPFYDASANIVIDSHVYYFAAAGTYSAYVNPAVCGQAAYIAQDTKFPVFIGEWALQVMYNNTLADRKTIFDTQRYAWQNAVAGGSFWTAVSYSTAAVDGQGTQREYWSYIDLINQGVITSATDEAYC